MILDCQTLKYGIALII